MVLWLKPQLNRLCICAFVFLRCFADYFVMDPLNSSFCFCSRIRHSVVGLVSSRLILYYYVVWIGCKQINLLFDWMICCMMMLNSITPFSYRALCFSSMWKRSVWDSCGMTFPRIFFILISLFLGFIFLIIGKQNKNYIQNREFWTTRWQICFIIDLMCSKMKGLRIN